MNSSSSIIPNEILFNFSNINLSSLIPNRKRRFSRLRNFLTRKTTKVAALTTYWGAETAALIALAFSAPSLGILAAFASLHIYASYVFFVAISTIIGK